LAELEVTLEEINDSFPFPRFYLFLFLRSQHPIEDPFEVVLVILLLLNGAADHSAQHFLVYTFFYYENDD
jgi:hypothetical protein